HRVVDGSQICVGLVESSGRLVGFSRVLTDFTFKALIFDVIVAQDYRGVGLRDRLVSQILEHDKLGGVKTLELYCLPELIPFYQRYGFSEDVGPIRLMRRMPPEPESPENPRASAAYLGDAANRDT